MAVDMQKTIQLDPTGAWTNQKESSIANSRYICVNRDSSPIGHTGSTSTSTSNGAVCYVNLAN